MVPLIDNPFRLKSLRGSYTALEFGIDDKHRRVMGSGNT